MSTVAEGEGDPLIGKAQPAEVPKFFAVINTLRGYSMIYVLLEHTLKLVGANQSWGDELGLPLWASSCLWPLGAQKSCGANGVAFFFVLSGLVAWLPFVETPGRISRALPTEEGLATYWIKRSGRILPIYFIAIVLLENSQSFWGFIVTDTVREGDAANSLNFWTDWILTMTLTSTFSTKFFYPGAYGILWCVGPIFFFSVILFPIWALILKIDRLRPISSASNGVAAAILIATFVRVLTKIPSVGLQVDETQGAISDSFLGRLDDFVVGMASALFLREQVPVTVALPILWLGWLSVSTYTYCTAYAIEQGFDYTTYRFTDTWWLWSALLAPMRSVGYSFCIIGFHHLLQFPSIAVTLPRYLFMTNHIMQAFGSMSYSVYVWHYLGLYSTFAGSPANDFSGLHPNAWRVFYTYTFMVAPLVVLSYVYIEQGTFGWYPQANDDLRTILQGSSLASYFLPPPQQAKPVAVLPSKI